MLSRLIKRSVVMGAVLATGLVGASSREAAACGGFFCSQTQPVNQSAERIVFADNGDGTVTAVIQIMYQGPSQNFSWLLPISTVPEDGEIAVSSDLAFARLQAATNPQYNLTTRVEGTCRTDFDADTVGRGGPVSATGGAGGSTALPPGQPQDPAVTVEATGVVGAFEWTVISLNPDLADPADAAVEWLEDNGYDVPSSAPDLLGPYLEDGMYLLALRLTKGSDVGSIRPLVLTYDADKPMIPIKLTAVAANQDMGVMTWLLSDARAVPYNYLGLELNEARINWFNANQNYNDVVTTAADEAMGQGFVTEFADESTTLSQAIWTSGDEQQWTSFRTGVYSSFSQIFNNAYAVYGQWSGFWDAVRSAVTLPDTVAFEDFQLCPSCYESEIQVAPAALMDALESNVIAPMRDMQGLFDGHEYVTRLYTTMSAAEMTADPMFTFNADLPAVSNLHSAERVIECNPDVYEFEANWRIDFPQGTTIRGTPEDVGTWPDEIADQPSSFRIMQLSDSGEGMVVEDNSGQINVMLTNYNDSVAPTAGSGKSSSGGGGCSLTTGNADTAAALWLLGLVGLAGVRRRRRSSRAG